MGILHISDNAEDEQISMSEASIIQTTDINSLAGAIQQYLIDIRSDLAKLYDGTWRLTGENSQIEFQQYDLTTDSWIRKFLIFVAQCADPDKPVEGTTVIWISDGTQFASAGDICIASTESGVTRRAILFRFDMGDVWS